MKTSDKGLAFIEGFEDFVPNPYMPTSDDVPTIGFGTTVYPNGKRVQLTDSAISRAKAVEYLAHDLAHCEADVSAHVKVPLTQGQFDALVSFVYNLGDPALESSTLLARLNAGNYAAAAEEFPRWNKQKGKVLAGLVRRRAGEKAMFLS